MNSLAEHKSELSPNLLLCALEVHEPDFTRRFNIFNTHTDKVKRDNAPRLLTNFPCRFYHKTYTDKVDYYHLKFKSKIFNENLETISMTF